MSIPGEHYVVSTEGNIYLQNVSLVELYNKKLQLLSTILVSTAYFHKYIIIIGFVTWPPLIILVQKSSYVISWFVM